MAQDSDESTQAQVGTNAAPVAAPPTAADPAPSTKRPNGRERRRMRKRMEEFERTRESLLLELGALVHELQRHGQRAPRLLLPKAAELAAIDAEVRALAADSDRRAGIRAKNCPACGNEVEPGQLVCLECGTSLDFRLAPAEPRWPQWVALAAVLIGLVIAGLVIANALGDDGDATPQAQRSGQELRLGDGTRPETESALPEASPSEEPAEGAQTRESTGDAAPKERVPASGREGALVRRGAIYEWPADLRAFTVVLTSNGDRDSAQRFAESAASENPDEQFGVLSSDDFSSLPENFFIVFAGRYDDEAEAQDAASRLSEQFGSAFAQLVEK